MIAYAIVKNRVKLHLSTDWLAKGRAMPVNPAQGFECMSCEYDPSIGAVVDGERVDNGMPTKLLCGHCGEIYQIHYQGVARRHER